jgi:hypothetical protein
MYSEKHCEHFESDTSQAEMCQFVPTEKYALSIYFTPNTRREGLYSLPGHNCNAKAGTPFSDLTNFTIAKIELCR